MSAPLCLIVIVEPRTNITTSTWYVLYRECANRTTFTINCEETSSNPPTLFPQGGTCIQVCPVRENNNRPSNDTYIFLTFSIPKEDEPSSTHALKSSISSSVNPQSDRFLQDRVEGILRVIPCARYIDESSANCTCRTWVHLFALASSILADVCRFFIY